MANLDYDYIIIGAGASGLLLADALGQDPHFSKMSILLLDRDAKNTNDRTWCFWEKGRGNFDSILYKKWNYIAFKSKEFSKRYAIAPYTYKMVRGIDFYSHYLNRISSYPNITFIQDTVVGIDAHDHGVTVRTASRSYSCKMAFNSIFRYDMIPAHTNYPVLQQHFLGWVIKTEKHIFNVDHATYMDFTIPQRGNTRFMYILPYSEDTALVEYTLFSDRILPKSEYEAAITSYIGEALDDVPFEIREREQGNIPMTCFDFSKNNTKHLVNIGTAGGWAKPSTGYTLMSTTKKIPKLVSALKQGDGMEKVNSKDRFWFYDLLFLDVLHRENQLGHTIFTKLFKKRSPQLIFKFLDEETDLLEEVRYIMACPKRPFIKALFRRMF